jgi:hypothetical protein
MNHFSYFIIEPDDPQQLCINELLRLEPFFPKTAKKLFLLSEPLQPDELKNLSSFLDLERFVFEKETSKGAEKFASLHQRIAWMDSRSFWRLKETMQSLAENIYFQLGDDKPPTTFLHSSTG